MTQLQDIQMLINNLNNVDLKLEKILSLQKASETPNATISLALQVEDVNKKAALEADGRGEDDFPFSRMFGGGGSRVDASMYTETIFELIGEGMFLDMLGVMWKRLNDERKDIVKQLKQKGVNV